MQNYHPSCELVAARAEAAEEEERVRGTPSTFGHCDEDELMPLLLPSDSAPLLAIGGAQGPPWYDEVTGALLDDARVAAGMEEEMKTRKGGTLVSTIYQIHLFKQIIRSL